MARPATPAAAGAALDADAARDGDGALPPAPGPAVVLWALVCGAFVVVGAGIVAVCVACSVVVVLPTAADRAQYAIVGATAGVIVVVAAFAWWHALRDRAADARRWVGLSLPFFVVVGAAAGLAFVDAALPDEAAMFPHRSLRACQRRTGHDSGPTVDACLPRADACQREVLAAGGVLADVDACLRR